jgi:hypothetical protein
MGRLSLKSKKPIGGKTNILRQILGEKFYKNIKSLDFSELDDFS